MNAHTRGCNTTAQVAACRDGEGYALWHPEAVSTDRDELRQLHAEAYRQYRRGMRRAWLGLGLSAAAAGGAAGVMRAVVRHYRWSVPLWAGILCMCAVAAYAAWAWRDGGKRLPCTRGTGHGMMGVHELPAEVPEQAGGPGTR